MAQLLNLLLYIPGAVEFAVFILVFLGLCLGRRRALHEVGQNIALAVFGTGTVMSIVSILLSFTDEFRPHYVFIHLLVTLLGFLGLRTRPKIQWMTLPLGAVVYALGFIFFTFVEAPLTLKATWTLHEKPMPDMGLPTEQRVQFRYGEKKNFVSSVYSDELAKSLKQKNKPEVEITLSTLYHWGVLAGYSLETVDGVAIPGVMGGGGCENECEPSPYPKYFLAPRTQFSRH